MPQQYKAESGPNHCHFNKNAGGLAYLRLAGTKYECMLLPATCRHLTRLRPSTSKIPLFTRSYIHFTNRMEMLALQEMAVVAPNHDSTSRAPRIASESDDDVDMPLAKKVNGNGNGNGNAKRAGASSSGDDGRPLVRRQ